MPRLQGARLHEADALLPAVELEATIAEDACIAPRLGCQSRQRAPRLLLRKNFFDNRDIQELGFGIIVTSIKFLNSNPGSGARLGDTDPIWLYLDLGFMPRYRCRIHRHGCFYKLRVLLWMPLQ